VTVRAARPWAAALAAPRAGGARRLVHQTLLHGPGGYELIVARGEYVLFAFADRNGNG